MIPNGIVPTNPDEEQELEEISGAFEAAALANVSNAADRTILGGMDQASVNVIRTMMMMPPGTEFSVRAIASRTGMDPDKVREVLAQPGFTEMLQEMHEAGMAAMVQSIHKTLYLQAISGNPTAMDKFLRRFDPKYEKKDEGGEMRVSPQQVLEIVARRSGADRDMVAKLLAGRAEIVVEDEGEGGEE